MANRKYWYYQDIVMAGRSGQLQGWRVVSSPSAWLWPETWWVPDEGLAERLAETFQRFEDQLEEQADELERLEMERHGLEVRFREESSWNG